jgi:O-antigen chain-terminating methyltransferase
MWDRYLTDLNALWDLNALQQAQEQQEDETHFRTSLWDQHLMTLNQSWHVASAYELPQPTSLPGKLLFPLKKLVLRWMQPALEAIVQRQNDVNARLVQTCNAVVDMANREAVQRIEAQKAFNARLMRAFNGVVDLLDEEFALLRRRYEELQMGVWTFESRKEALEVEQVLLNQKLEQVLALLREQPAGKQPAQSRDLPDSDRQSDYTYVLFEHKYRGDEAALKRQQAEYLPYFQQQANVLDIGCGRGEFLELLQEQGISAYGLDMNRNMVEYCRKKGLRVENMDMISHLQSLDDNSLGGIFAAQVVEHRPPSQLSQLLQLCFQKLKPQAYIVLETQNPTSIFALSHFHRDLSHEKPIHPDALEFLMKTSGFSETQIAYKAPFPQEYQLQELLDLADGDETLRTNVVRLNHNIRQLNTMLYGYLDYAVIAQKTAPFS